MKNKNCTKVKSFLLAMMLLVSSSITAMATGENVVATENVMHDIHCKFDCDHTENSLASNVSDEVNLVSEAELVELIASDCGLSTCEVRDIMLEVLNK